MNSSKRPDLFKSYLVARYNTFNFSLFICLRKIFGTVDISFSLGKIELYVEKKLDFSLVRNIGKKGNLSI